MIYDIYFWWCGWEKRVGLLYDSYHKVGLSIYPPNPSRGWVVIGTPEPAYTPRTFRELRKFLKAKGLI